MRSNEKVLSALATALAGTTNGDWDYCLNSKGSWELRGECRKDDMSDSVVVAGDVKEFDDVYFLVVAKLFMPGLIAAVEALQGIVEGKPPAPTALVALDTLYVTLDNWTST